MSTREDILAYIHGKEVVIPNLHSLFTDWPAPAVNPNYQKLAPISTERLKRYLQLSQSPISSISISSTQAFVYLI
jgi:hypothetical protein